MPLLCEFFVRIGKQYGLCTMAGYGLLAFTFWEFTRASSNWLQLVWLTVGSTVETWDLFGLSDNSIPTAPTKHPICSE